MVGELRKGGGDFKHSVKKSYKLKINIQKLKIASISLNSIIAFQ
jgi:hypothetical protein